MTNSVGNFSAASLSPIRRKVLALETKLRDRIALERIDAERDDDGSGAKADRGPSACCSVSPQRSQAVPAGSGN